MDESSVEQPLVSVVVPTVNRMELLRETVASILAQTLPSLELIVVSDGGTDATAEMLSEFMDPRIRFFQQPAAGRPAVPRNFGIRHARGRFVAFCDDDDLWMPEKLSRQVALMERRPEVGLCYTGVMVLEGDKSIQFRRRRETDGDLHSLLIGNHVVNSSTLLRREVFDRVGMLNENPLLKAVEDYEMWLRVAATYRLGYVVEPLVQYRTHAQNISGRRVQTSLRSIRVLRGIRTQLQIPLSTMLPYIAQHFLRAVWYFIVD